MPQHVDVILAALADVTRDARTVNLARRLASAGLSVAVLGSYREMHHEPFVQLAWNDPGGRALKRWWSFTRACAAEQMTASLVIAMDVFALAGSLRLARRSSSPLFYDMRELNFALGPLQGKGLKQTVITRHEERSLRYIKSVLVSGELDADLVQQRFGLSDRPTVLLNTPPYRDVVQSPLRSTCRLDALTPLVIYQGVVHHGRGLEPFFHAMALMPDVHLAVLGDGPAMPDLQRRSQQVGVGERVHWLGSVPYDDLHAYTCGADVGLCLIEPLSLSYEYALPNKLFEYMNARIPSITTDLPALRQHLERYPVGGLVERTLDPVQIAEVTKRLLNTEIAAPMKHACESIRELSYEHQSTAACSLITAAVRNNK
jgi:glycosyltransferase involved in cell wall biosynthesis